MILDDTDNANRKNFVPLQSLTWCSPGNFSQGDQEPALGAHWFQITITCVKERIEGGDETKNQRGRGGGGWIEILSTVTSTQILNHETPPPQKKKKKN